MDREKVFGTEASHDHPVVRTIDFNGGEGPPAKKPGAQPAADASGVDALVSEFLEELNMVSAELAGAHKPAAEPRKGFTPKPDMSGGVGYRRTSSGPRTNPAFELEEEGAEDRDAIDAELAKTLLELEGRPKSNVVPLTIRDSARPQSQDATVPEISAAPESCLVPRSEVTVVAPHVVPAKPEIRFIPAPIEDEPQENSQEDAIAHIRTRLTALSRLARQKDAIGTAALADLLAHVRGWLEAPPLPRRTVAIAAAALVLITAATFAYRYFASPSAGVGAPSRAPVSRQAATTSGIAAKPAGTTAAKAPAATPNAADGRRPFEPSPSARGTSSAPRKSPSVAPPATDQSGSDRAGAAKTAENAAFPAAGRGEAPTGATGGAAGSGKGAAPIPAPGIADSRGTAAPPPPVVDPPPPATSPTQLPAQKLDAAKPVSEAPPRGSTQIPAVPRTAPFATAPPPANLRNLEPRTDAGTVKINPSTLATPAVPLTRVSPRYPATASRMQVKGKVELTVEVDEHGNVLSARAIDGPLVLRPAAEEALKQWRFKPATLRGANIKSEVTVSVEFKQ